MATPKCKPEKPQQIQVFVRTRPISQQERNNRSTTSIEVRDKDVFVKHVKKYTFDKVFGPNTKQIDVYETVVQPLISQMLAGYSCTVFAYGQTGAGKTFTMVGEPSDSLNKSWQKDEKAGIIPRAMSHIFDELRLVQQESTVRVSYLELYNEELYDLLSVTDDNSRVRLYEDPQQKGSVIIQGIEEHTVVNKNEVFKIIEKGQEKRQTAATLMNAQSSRSHTVFTITVHTRETTDDGEMLVKTGKLYLVDLAGSENIGKSGSIDKRAREAGSINQSLLTLGRVIKALVERGQHIPYRESKLTRILQDSLGGRTKTSIIANISLASSNLEETLSTLEYANRARTITNRPEINLRTSQKGLILEYMNEIDRLRKDLAAARSGTGGVYLAQENYDRLVADSEIKTEELSEKIVFVRELQEKISALEERKAHIESEWQALQKSFEISNQHISALSKELEKTRIEKEEEQYVTKCLEEKNLKFHNETNELLRITKSSFKNEDHLHKKIDGVRAAANQNIKFVRSVISNVGSKQRELSNGLQDYVDSSKVTTGAINILVEASRQDVTNLQLQHDAFLTKFVEDTNLSMSKIFSDLNETQLKNLDVYMNTVYSKFAETLEKYDLLSKNNITKLECLTGLINNDRKQRTEFCNYVDKQISDLNSSVKENLCVSQKITEDVVNIVDFEFIKCEKYLNTQQKSLNVNIARKQKNQEDIKRLELLLSEAQALAHTMNDDASLLEQTFQEETVANENCLTSLTDAKSRFNTSVNSLSDTRTRDLKTIEGLKDIKDHINTENIQFTSDTRQHDLIHEIKSCQESQLCQTQTILLEMESAITEMKNEELQHFESIQNTIKLQSQETCKTVDLQIGNHSNFTKCIRNLENIQNKITNLEDGTNKIDETSKSTLRSTLQDMTNLGVESLDLRQSGDTPLRSRLPSALGLLAPSPRQQILMRFKNQNQNHNPTDGDVNE